MGVRNIPLFITNMKATHVSQHSKKRWCYSHVKMTSLDSTKAFKFADNVSISL